MALANLDVLQEILKHAKGSPGLLLTLRSLDNKLYAAGSPLVSRIWGTIIFDMNGAEGSQSYVIKSPMSIHPARTLPPPDMIHTMELRFKGSFNRKELVLPSSLLDIYGPRTHTLILHDFECLKFYSTPEMKPMLYFTNLKNLRITGIGGFDPEYQLTELLKQLPNPELVESIHGAWLTFSHKILALVPNVKS